MDLLTPSQVVDTSIKQLLIFKPDIPTKEGEDEKKLIYSYSNQGRYSDIANLGLFQTMIGFFSKFSEPVTTVHMENTKAFLYSPEPSFWISYTVASDTPMLDESGVDFLKFLCDSFIFLTGSFTHQFTTSYDLFIYKLKKFFDVIMPSITNDMLTTPGRFTHYQNILLKMKEVDILREYVGDFKEQFTCVVDYAFFYNSQLMRSSLECDVLVKLYNLFNEIRNGNMDFGNKFNSLRSANDERRVVFGIPEERSRTKELMAVTKETMNCPIYVNGKELRWVVYEHKLFFLHFFVDVENEDSMSSFLLFLSTGLPEVFEGMLTPQLLNNIARLPKDLFNKHLTYRFINYGRETRFGSITMQNKNDVEKLMNYVELMRKYGNEIYVKDSKGKWIIYIFNSETDKMVEMIAQYGSNCSLSDCYRDVREFIGKTFVGILK